MEMADRGWQQQAGKGKQGKRKAPNRMLGRGALSPIAGEQAARTAEEGAAAGKGRCHRRDPPRAFAWGGFLCLA